MSSSKKVQENMCGISDGGEDWIYLLSQHDAMEDAEAQQQAVAATATANTAGEENKSNGNGNDDDKAAAAAAAAQEDEVEFKKQLRELEEECPPWSRSTPEQVESFDKAHLAWIAASRRADEERDGGRHDKEEALRTYTEACRAALRTYTAASQRAQAKIDAAVYDQLKADNDYFAKVDAAAASASANTGGGDDVVVENPYYDRYNSSNDDDTYPYYRGYAGAGGSGPTASSLGLGSGYDYDRRYGYGGFPGAYGGPATRSSGYDYGGFPDAYGPATTGSSGYGYGGYGGGNYPYVPGYKTAVYQLAPPPALNASLYPVSPPLPPFVYPAVALAPNAYVPPAVHPDFSGYPARADEAVAPTTQPPLSFF